MESFFIIETFSGELKNPGKAEFLERNDPTT